MQKRGTESTEKRSECKHFYLKFARKNNTVRCMKCKKFWVDPYSRCEDEYSIVTEKEDAIKSYFDKYFSGSSN